MNVLIVNDNLIGDCNPVGYTMQNMLVGIKDVKYLQYCVDYREKEHLKLEKSIFCKKTDSLAFVLKELMLKSIKCLRKLKRSLRKHKNKNTNDKVENASTVDTDAVPKPITVEGHSPKGELLRGVFYVLPCRVSKENMSIIKAFKPDVIYTLAENIRVIKFTIKLSKKLGIPIVYHGMDDWKDTAYIEAPYLKPFRKILYSKFEELHKYSVENIAICEKMAKYYSKCYNTPYTFAGNCIQEYNDAPYKAQNNSMKLLFSGGLHYHRGELLQEVAELIENLNDEGYNISMEILAPHVHIASFKCVENKYPHTEWHGYGYPQRDKIKQFGTADILFHTDIHDESTIRFLRYSFSTKIPEYLAIGRCMVAYGPKEIGTIGYIEDENCGYVADSIEDLRKILIRLYENPTELESFAEGNARLGREVFSREAMQKTIYETLKRSAEEYALHN